MALSEPEVTVTIAVPLATAVTNPADETVATAVFVDDQVTVGPDITVPPASLTVAARVTVSPTDVNVFSLGVSSTVDAAWATVTETVVLAEPEVAVIVAVPFATEVTRPADETVATPVSDDVQVTVAPDITLPTASFTVALSVAVSPTDEKASELGENSTVAAT